MSVQSASPDSKVGRIRCQEPALELLRPGQEWLATGKGGPAAWSALVVADLLETARALVLPSTRGFTRLVVSL
jgi:hypothetical protein